MPAMEMLCQIIDVNPQNFSHHENMILEAELFHHLNLALINKFKKQYKNYFQLMKYNQEMEKEMLEANFIRCLINDIVASEEYTVPGIAVYTHTPEDIIYEVLSGQNTNPSLMLSRKIIELHRSIRPQLYKAILEKVT